MCEKTLEIGRLPNNIRYYLLFKDYKTFQIQKNIYIEYILSYISRKIKLSMSRNERRAYFYYLTFKIRINTCFHSNQIIIMVATFFFFCNNIIYKKAAWCTCRNFYRHLTWGGLILAIVYQVGFMHLWVHCTFSVKHKSVHRFIDNTSKIILSRWTDQDVISFTRSHQKPVNQTQQ